MLRITVEGATLAELSGSLFLMASQFGMAAGEPAPKATPRKVGPVPLPSGDRPKPAADPVDRELLEEVPPQPNAVRGAVDAGTGQPIAAPTGEAPVQMTMDQVRTNAAKLAAKDSPTLAAILKKYGAGKLSEVAGEQLGDFASDVMEALG